MSTLTHRNSANFRRIVTALFVLAVLLPPVAALKPEAKGNDAAAKAAAAAAAKKQSKFKPFAEVTKDAKKYEGLFTLYQKDEHLYAAINAGQFDQPFLAPIAIARGMASAGMPLNFGDEWVIEFHRSGDNVQIVRTALFSGLFKWKRPLSR